MDDLEMDEPSPEFMAASYVAQIAPLLFDVADKAPEIGETPQHVAVAEETVTAHLKRQNFDVERSVATVRTVDEGLEIEYKGRTATLSFGDAS
ncbi:MAG TPA: hypothetical protein VJ884_00080 [Salinibacter sp.]|nr:hypothetical protein [Salinibacter sp.]